MGDISTRIKFWSGLKTIGGTIVSVEYEESRVIFDFGLNYNPAEEFSGIVKPREYALVEDYINLGKIPPIDGLYPLKDLRNIDTIIPAEEDERNTAVFISHIHLDHIGAMGLIAPSIPVYLTEDSLKLYRVFEAIGEGVPGDRDYSTIEYDTEINIGNIKVTAVQLDHDVLGACGLFIETPDIRIVYSGDLRIHGKHPELTMNFIERANILKPTILMMEGTMINGERDSRETKPSFELTGINTESQIKELFLRSFKKTQGLVIINASERNIERLADIIEASEASGRKIILEPETAYLMWKTGCIKNFLIYKSEELERTLSNNCKTEWLTEVMNKYESITYKEINLDTERYVLQNSFRNLMEILDLNLNKSLYIHSNAVPLGAYDPDWEKLQNFLNKLKVNYEYIGASGHAFHSHLKYFIDKIKPEILIPLHSFYPEKLYPESKLQYLPGYGIDYIVKNNKMTKVKIK